MSLRIEIFLELYAFTFVGANESMLVGYLKKFRLFKIILHWLKCTLNSSA